MDIAIFVILFLFLSAIIWLLVTMAGNQVEVVKSQKKWVEIIIERIDRNK